MELLKQLSASEVFAQIISFLFLLFLLRVFAWNRLLKLLDERKQKIASEFDKIAQAKSDIEKLKTDYEEKMKSADGQALQKIQAATREGEDKADEIKRDAQQEAQRIIESARADIKYEIANARDELKDKIIDLALRASEVVIEEKITDKQDRKIVEEFLDRIDTAK